MKFFILMVGFFLFYEAVFCAKEISKKKHGHVQKNKRKNKTQESDLSFLKQKKKDKKNLMYGNALLYFSFLLEGKRKETLKEEIRKNCFGFVHVACEQSCFTNGFDTRPQICDKHKNSECYKQFFTFNYLFNRGEKQLNKSKFANNEKIMKDIERDFLTWHKKE